MAQLLVLQHPDTGSYSYIPWYCCYYNNCHTIERGLNNEIDKISEIKLNNFHTGLEWWQSGEKRIFGFWNRCLQLMKLFWILYHASWVRFKFHAKYLFKFISKIQLNLFEGYSFVGKLVSKPIFTKQVANSLTESQPSGTPTIKRN